MRAGLAAVALCVLYAAEGREVTLRLPHALHAGETAWLAVEVGAVTRGAEIVIETTAGRPLGVVSPHGGRSGEEAGTYSVPVPPDAIARDRLSLRMFLRYAKTERAPTEKEVKSVQVKILPARL